MLVVLFNFKLTNPNPLLVNVRKLLYFIKSEEALLFVELDRTSGTNSGPAHIKNTFKNKTILLYGRIQ